MTSQNSGSFRNRVSPRPAGLVAGRFTSCRQAGLTPASSYQYRVMAVLGRKRSPQSAILPLSTLTLPISHARLQGVMGRLCYLYSRHPS